MSKWANLLTEQRNPETFDIDEKTTLEILRVINEEDKKVAYAVEQTLEDISKAVEAVVDSFRRGGRLFYVGAGTSGRLGYLDASECPPTYNADPSMVQGIIAGGEKALVRSYGKEEDFPEKGAKALIDRGVGKQDTVMGIAASGATPFVRGAIEEARSLGARTIFLTCSPSSAGEVDADVKIVPVVGPEVITGSTRMKAGTATKIVLNMLTTASMIKLGKVYSNLMVDLKPSSQKLRDRTERILSTLTGVSAQEAESLLNEAGWNLKTAIVMKQCDLDLDAAEERLRRNDGVVRKALGNTTFR